MFEMDFLEFKENLKLSFKIDYMTPHSPIKQLQYIYKLLGEDDASPIYNNNTFSGDAHRRFGELKIYNKPSYMNIYRLQTGTLHPDIAINLLNNILQYINEKGYTNDNCNLIINIHYVGNDLRFKSMNVVKFFAGLDLTKYIKKWKTGRRIISKNVNEFIVPKNVGGFINFITIDPNKFKINPSKSYGIDVDTIKKNYLVVKYIGGGNYHYDAKSINEMIDVIVRRIYETIYYPEYTAFEMGVLKRVVTNYNEGIKTILTYDDFKENYPAIRLYVDLKNDVYTINNHYSAFKNILYYLVIIGNMRRGIINYDRDVGKMQVKDTNFLNLLYISDTEFYDIKISGFFNSCTFNRCEIEDSDLYRSKILGNTRMYKSSANKCVIIGDNNKINESYLYKCYDIRANIKKSVLKLCTTDFNSEIDKKTKMI